MLEYELSRTYFAFLLFRPADKLPHQPMCGVSHRHCAHVLGSQLSLMWKSAPLRNTELFKGSFHSSHLMFSLFGCLDPN